MAAMLGVSQATVWRLQDYALSQSESFAALSDDELDEVVKEVKTDFEHLEWLRDGTQCFTFEETSHHRAPGYSVQYVMLKK